MRRYLLQIVFIVVALFTGPGSLFGQSTALYTYSTLTGIYTDISATGTPVTGPPSGSLLGTSLLDANVNNIPIGFTFTYCTVPYTQLSACNHGAISLANAAGTPFVNTAPNMMGAGVGFLMAFWMDIRGSGSNAFYQTTGAAPNRVFTIQYTNVVPSGGGWTTGSGMGSFQIKLYETTGVIEYWYGPSTFTGVTGTTSGTGASIGIGNSTTNYKMVNGPGIAAATFGTWNAAFSSFPPANSILRWSPCPMTISATNSGPVCPGGSVTLTGTAGGTPYTSVTWAGPASFSATGSLTATVTPVTAASAGIYTVTLNNGTCTVNATTAVTVSPAPAAFTITPSVSTMCGPPQLLTAPGAYVWSGTAGLFTDAAATTPYIAGTPTNTVYAAPATSTVYTVTATLGSCSTTATATVNVSTSVLPITGTPSVCTGATTPLSSLSPGGTWSTSNPAVGTVSATGVLTGITAGTTTVTYTVGPCFNTTVATVYPTPAGITPVPAVVCLSATATLNNITAGGTWSTSAPAIGTINATTGVLSGLALGTTVVSYTLPTGCYSTAIATVNPNPLPITGPVSACVGVASSYTSGPAGGFWTISPPGIASINPVSGASTGLSAGTTIITYTAGGCRATLGVTVVTAPGPISGPASLCNGTCATYTNATIGGTWSTSAPAVATVNPTTGSLCGLSVGSTILTYSLSAGCFTTITVNITAAPSAPTGPSSVCVGSSITLTHGTPGGAWSVACPAIATVPSAGVGTVNGVGAGTCTVTYTLPGGCIATRVITVNAPPNAITGPATVCQGSTGTFANTTPSGSWSSAPTTVGTINATTGVFTGLTAGTATITYTDPLTTCFTTAVVTVSPAPTPITGPATVCAGSTITMTGSPVGGLWGVAPASAGIASVSGGGVVTGLAGGTAIISYTTPSTCFDTIIVTVLDTPTAVVGPLAICVGATTTLSSSPTGGTWASAVPAIANVISTGVSGGTSTAVVGGVSANTVNITYTRSNGCFRTSVLTVNALPGTITGNTPVCVTSSITLSATPTGGTWSTLSGNVTVGAATGVVTGVTAGTAVVTYSLGSGCNATTIITVNPLPAALTGPTQVCESSCITLASTSGGGTWASSNVAVGTVNTTGVVCGVAAGTTNITYTLGTGCRRVQTITVNALPAAIAGAGSVCVNQCTLLSSSPAGGTWASSNMAVGTINAGGNFCGVSFGTTTVTYTAPTTGCIRTTVMAVNPLPTGISPAAPQVCEGSCTPVIGTPGGGIWSSSTPSVGSITSAGSFCGVSAGTTTLTYTMGSGCFMTVTGTVNSVPTPVTGTLTVCVNSTTTLSATPAGGTWSSPSGNVTVNSTTGEVTGATAGTAAITYAVGTGCRSTAVVTVLALPAAITGTPSVCVGGTTTLTSTPGGAWSVLNPVLGTISTTGVVTGLSSTGADTTTIFNTGINGCSRGVVLTVFAPPTAITGTAVVCVGQTTTLTSTPAGGTWTSANGLVATVDAVTGVVTGQSGPLTTTISYTLGTGCRTTQVVTVYGLPSAISGPSVVCAGADITLTTTTPGGTWASSDITVATVGSSTGIVTGGTGVLSTATATISYIVGSGCYRTRIVTVNPIPTAITGTLQVCEAGGTTTLTGAPAGGTWASSTPAVATVNSGGVVTGVVAGGPTGTSTITYTLSGTGCYRTEVVTVNQLPSVFTGPSVVCVNETITLGSTPTGGTWSSPSATVTAGATTGDITGVSAGTAQISYTAPTTGCVRTGNLTVNPLPVAITGTLDVCVNSTTALTNGSGGGTWSSSNPAVGSISSGGVVSGLSAGTTLVSYTFVSTGCRITAPVTVNQLPTNITGPDGFCNFSTATYGSLPAGGTWSSSNPAELTFTVPTSGDLYGNGTATTTGTITYTLPTGCKTTKDVFLIFAPYPITGPDKVCLGDTIVVADTIAGGIWSSSAPFIAPIVPATTNTAYVMGSVPGTTTISYTLSTGCYSVKDVTVNPNPVGITGVPQVCEGLTTDLDNVTPGGVWSSSDVTIATVGTSDGIVSGINGGAAGNTVTITYALGTGCNAKQILTVNPLPSVITGTFNVCEGLTTTLTSGGAVAGTWTSADPAVAAADPATGIISGVSAAASGVNGIGQTRITYTLATGCLRTQDFTVNALPADISGISNICENDMTVLGNATPGGTWISSNSGIATVNSFGVVTGIVGGNVVITYMLSTGCIKTWPMTVNANPDTITGALQVCAGFATNLHSGPAGGVWSSAPASNIYGTINTITGVVSGITAGLVPVTYTLGSGCNATAVVTVVNLPALIGGTASVCAGGSTTVLTHPVAGGVWSAANPTIASVDPLTGVVTGNNAGTTTVSYTVGTGCFNIRTVTVNPLPAPITGTLTVCERFSTTLVSAPAGGDWISDSTHRAYIITATGVATGVSAGQAQIRYKLSTGCTRYAVLTVNPTPDTIVGNPHICMGSANWYTDATAGGTWSIGNSAIANLLAPLTTQTVTALPVTPGATFIRYTNSYGCYATKNVTVQPLPVVYNVTGGGSYCAGGIGVNIGLDGSQPGVSYVLYRGSIAVGYLSGTGFALNFGLLTTGGTYSVVATNATSGCGRAMAGSAVVTVITPATPTVSITAGPADSVCPGETVTLTPVATSGGTAPMYTWKINGVIVGTGATYSYVPADGDVASVQMTSNGTCLATTTASGNRTLHVLPVALPVANVIAGPNDSVCEFSMVTLSAASTYGGSSPVYWWLVNGTYTTTAPTYSYVPNNGDIVTVMMKSNYRCRTVDTVASNDVTLYVEPMLIPGVTVYPEPGYEVTAGKPVKLRAIATDAGSAPKFQWKVNGYPVAGATADTFTSIFNDYDSISCVVTSSGICGNIGTFDWAFITTSPLGVTAAEAGMDLRLHPNPNHGMFTVKGRTGLTGNGVIPAEITNMLGQVVYRGALKMTAGKVDAQLVLDGSLSSGMYLLTLQLDGQPKTFHFVLEQ